MCALPVAMRPDIFEVPYLMAPTYAQQGLLLDIEPYLDQMPHFKEAYTEEYLEKCYVAGGMYMIAARPYIPYADYSIRRDWLGCRWHGCAHHAGRTV